MDGNSQYDDLSGEVFHIYLCPVGEVRKVIVQDVNGLFVDRWLKENGTRYEHLLMITNAETLHDISAPDWMEMREHLMRKEEGFRMKGPFSIFVQHGDLVEYVIEDAAGEVVAAWADQNKHADYQKVVVRDEGDRKRYDVDDWVKAWKLRKMFGPVEESQDPLEFLSELNRIADRNMRVRKILMTVMSQTVRNMNDENKDDRRKAIGLGEILESSTAEILELFED